MASFWRRYALGTCTASQQRALQWLQQQCGEAQLWSLASASNFSRIVAPCTYAKEGQRGNGATGGILCKVGPKHCADVCTWSCKSFCWNPCVIVKPRSIGILDTAQNAVYLDLAPQNAAAVVSLGNGIVGSPGTNRAFGGVWERHWPSDHPEMGPNMAQQILSGFLVDLICSPKFCLKMPRH